MQNNQNNQKLKQEVGLEVANNHKQTAAEL